MKRVTFTLLAITALMMGQATADIIQTTIGATGTVPMVPGSIGYTITGGTVLGTDAGVSDPVNTWEVGNRYSVSDDSMIMIEFTSAIPANYIALRTKNFAANSVQNVGTLSTMGGSSADFGATSIAGTSSNLGYTPATGVLDHLGGGDLQGGTQILGNTSAMITKVTLTIPELADDNAVIAAFGFNKTAIMAAVPEPSSLMFLGLVATGLGVRRRYFC